MARTLTSRLRGALTRLGVARPATHRDFLLDLLPKAAVGAEVGVHLGGFSAELLRVANPRVLHLIDPWAHETDETYADAWYGGMAEGGQQEMDRRYQAVCRRFRRQVRAGQVVIHRANSDDALATLPDGSLDWVYIDGNHLYEFVAKDLALSLQKVKAGGLIAGDDYQEGGWWDSGVRRAVDEFVASQPVEVVEIRNRQFVLRR